MYSFPFDYDLDNIDVKYEDLKGKKLEVLKNLIFNFFQPHLMNYYGCENANKNDKLHMNQIKFILFKDSEIFEISVGNENISAYSTILGYMQVMNIATAGNTEEQNEVVFNDLIEYCQKVAMIGNKRYVPTFDDIYLENSLKTKIYKPFVIIELIIVFVIIINCFFYYVE